MAATIPDGAGPAARHSPRASYQTVLREAEHRILSKNDVVEDLDVQEASRGNQPGCDALVLGRRFDQPRRMVVSEKQGRGTDLEGEREECPSGRPHLFGGRAPPDDGTIHVSIGEERPWQGSVVRPQSGRR